MERFKVITVTHKRINLKEIGQFVAQAPAGMELREKLAELRDEFGVGELMYLATCNRVMYFFVSDTPLTEAFAARFLLAVNPGLSGEVLEHIGEYACLFEGMDAMRHLLDVAAAIDSLVVGEHQILGQLREAYDQCQAWGLTGDNIRLAIQHAITAAKGVYSNTRIGDKPVSIVSLAFRQILKSQLPKTARILVIGAGQTNQLVGKFLAKYEFSNVRVFNRSVEKATELAIATGGTAHPLSALHAYTGGFDCLIVCTAATSPVITPALYERLLHGDRDRKIVIDLSIPHNVDAAVSRNFNVNYVEIESLRLLAKENLAAREEEVKHARQLLAGYLEEFPVLYRQRQLALALRSIPEEIKTVRTRALAEVFRKEVDALDAPTRELIDRMMAYMEKKCIGIPMRAAREVFLR